VARGKYQGGGYRFARFDTRSKRKLAAGFDALSKAKRDHGDDGIVGVIPYKEIQLSLRQKA
jgi:hypothetical protein